MLAEYDAIAPGSSAIIVEMARDPSNHRMQQETTVIESNVVIEQRGQVSPCVVFIVGKKVS